MSSLTIKYSLSASAMNSSISSGVSIVPNMAVTFFSSFISMYPSLFRSNISWEVQKYVMGLKIFGYE